MRVVAVTRVLNEDDIVEAFVRHHAPMVDHHVFLDNGSVDRTLDILAELFVEGLHVTVVQNLAVHYAEEQFNADLLAIAARELAADWICFLDCDEFIDDRNRPGGLRASLACVGPDLDCHAIDNIDYVATPDDNMATLLVPARMIWRDRVAPNPVPRISVRGRLAHVGARVVPGNHAAMLGDAEIPMARDPRLVVAHYAQRDPWQWLAKSTIGRLKILAAGAAEATSGRSYHYVPAFEALRDTPAEVLRRAAAGRSAVVGRDLVHDPIDYRGAALRLTQPVDPPAKAARALVAYAEGLALRHAHLIDRNEAVRLQVAHEAGLSRRLF